MSFKRWRWIYFPLNNEYNLVDDCISDYKTARERFLKAKEEVKRIEEIPVNTIEITDKTSKSQKELLKEAEDKVLATFEVMKKYRKAMIEQIQRITDLKMKLVYLYFSTPALLLLINKLWS